MGMKFSNKMNSRIPFLLFSSSCFHGFGKQINCFSRLFSTEAELLDIFQTKSSPTYEREIVPDIKSKPKVTRVEKKGKLEDVIICCKKPEFNHYRNQKYDKLKPIPLASKGWTHNKSKGDSFLVHIFNKDYNSDHLYWDETVQNFSLLDLDEIFIDALKKLGYNRPTNIQIQSHPALLSGSNTLIAAETGCGKTLAFLIPVLQQILDWKKQLPKREPNTPLALILTPSRELAVQIGKVAKELSHHLPFSYDVLVGGKTKQKMVHPTFRDIDLQIATLGAISKLTTTGIFNVSEVRHLVIDESDTLLDDSFNEYLLRYLRKFKIRYKGSRRNQPTDGCQLTLVSATFPKNFDGILEDFIEPGSFTKVVSKGLHRFLPHVPQTFYRLGPTQKPNKLLQLVKQAMAQNHPTLIFSNRSPTSDWVSLMLHENGVPALNLNGEMPLAVRMGKFDEFQNGEANVLSCTDIASRGLDTKRVKHIINYDFPVYVADYIHRCGRTGRCGSSHDCKISNFVSANREVEMTQEIELAVRTMEALPNVNANITQIIKNKIMKDSSFESGEKKPQI